MSTVNVRHLRNHGGEVLDRVSAGEEVIVERSGTPVARLLPIAPRRLDAETLVERRRPLPPLDIEQFRADVDTAIDAGV